jgi:hypothetical protein
MFGRVPIPTAEPVFDARDDRFDGHRTHRRLWVRSVAVVVAFGASAFALGPAAVAAPAAPKSETKNAAPVSGSLVAADEGPPDATATQRAAAELAAGSAMANNPPAPAGSSSYVEARGMGELAVVTGQATTASATEPNDPVGVTLAPVFETAVASQFVNYDGVNFAYTSFQSGAAEVVGSTTVGRDQQIVIMRNPSAPKTYVFQLTQDQVAAGASVRMSATVPGGAEVVVGGTEVATIAKPWARTNTGIAVPTSFAVANGRLVLTVDTTGLPASAYPVTADPDTTRNCGYITCTWYFSVAKSKQLADAALSLSGAVILDITAGYICLVVAAAAAGAAGVGALLGLVCGVLSSAALRSYGANVGDARKRKGCFTVSSPPKGPFGNVPASNKYCHRK